MGELLASQENICADCPGSLWGKHSICRIHGCSIGAVDHCHEWDVHEERTLQRDFYLVAAALQQMETDIKSYAWNRRQIMELERQLDRLDGITCAPGSSMVAQYGIEATLPRSTAPEEDDDAAYKRKLQRLKEIREQIARVDRAAAVITDERERGVLEGLLDGLPMKDIAFENGISRRTVERTRLLIVRTMALARRNAT